MATVGSVSSEATIPSSGFAFQGLNVNTQAWSTFTMPSPGGRITKLHCYFDAHVASGTGRVVLWDAGGNVLASASVGTVNVGSGTNGGQHWHNAALSGFGVYVKGGSTISIGLFMPGADGFEISSISGGTSRWNGVGFGSPASQAGSGSTGIGSLGAFAEYVPCLRKVRRGGVWVESPKRIRRSGAWVIGPRFIRRSGAWVQVQ